MVRKLLGNIKGQKGDPGAKGDPGVLENTGVNLLPLDPAMWENGSFWASGTPRPAGIKLKEPIKLEVGGTYRIADESNPDAGQSAINAFIFDGGELVQHVIRARNSGITFTAEATDCIVTYDVYPDRGGVEPNDIGSLNIVPRLEKGEGTALNDAIHRNQVRTDSNTVSKDKSVRAFFTGNLPGNGFTTTAPLDIGIRSNPYTYENNTLTLPGGVWLVSYTYVPLRVGRTSVELYHNGERVHRIISRNMDSVSGVITVYSDTEHTIQFRGGSDADDDNGF